jgi:hypothetical protein
MTTTISIIKGDDATIEMTIKDIDAGEYLLEAQITDGSGRVSTARDMKADPFVLVIKEDGI